MGEDRAHACADGLDGKRIGAIIYQNKTTGADGITGAQHRAQIAGVAHRLGNEPYGRGATVNIRQGGPMVAIDADHGLCVVLARQLGHDVRARFDDVAAVRKHLRLQRNFKVM